ncbi:MAG: DUF4127 family protein [Cyanothece sp. SIO2G6]|nr:DUF4127 family protein [Cyanothece sp. SIO2G6]
MKILYVPLDERPCNRLYPQYIARLQPQLELVVPPLELLGQKKQPADVAALWAWLEAQINQTVDPFQVAILSIEMLVYGGLLPSRLHHHSETELRDRLQRFRQLKAHNPDLSIFASNLIMRTPAYDSGEEEPDYYEHWGKLIFKWGWYQDKQQRQGLTELATQAFNDISQTLPSDLLADYQQRRAKNLTVNQGAIALVRDCIIDFLAIPQDDSTPYGFTAMDQHQVGQWIRSDRLQSRIHVYPGADEVGCTLLARAYSQITATRSKIYLFYSGVQAQTLVPLYEDRPLSATVQAHVLATGAQVVSQPEVADVIVAVNTPGTVMLEAWDQATKDVTYNTHRNLRFFVDQIGQYMAAAKQVAIADIAFANGGETELVELLDETQLWDGILAYAGWNTCGNTLGSVLSMAILGMNGGPMAVRANQLQANQLQANQLQANQLQANQLQINQIQANKIYHLLEGWAYQAIARTEIVHQYLPTIGASYYNFNGKEPEILGEIEQRLRHIWTTTMRHSFQQCALETVAVFSPWQRMFEIGIDLVINHQSLD